MQMRARSTPWPGGALTRFASPGAPTERACAQGDHVPQSADALWASCAAIRQARPARNALHGVSFSGVRPVAWQAPKQARAKGAAWHAGAAMAGLDVRFRPAPEAPTERACAQGDHVPQSAAALWASCAAIRQARPVRNALHGVSFSAVRPVAWQAPKQGRGTERSTALGMQARRWWRQAGRSFPGLSAVNQQAKRQVHACPPPVSRLAPCRAIVMSGHCWRLNAEVLATRLDLGVLAANCWARSARSGLGPQRKRWASSPPPRSSALRSQRPSFHF